jgi:hypothetical protein
MPSALRSTDHLLQSLPAAEFETLRSRLESVELVRETVLVEAGPDRNYRRGRFEGNVL